MALIVPQGMLIRLIWTLGGVPTAVNVLGARTAVGGQVNQGMAEAMSTVFKTAMTNSALSAQLSNQVALASVAVRGLMGPNLPEFISSSAPVAGTAPGNLLPPQCAVCITLRTALAGKSYRGRYYQFGYPVSAATAAGTCTPGANDATVAFIQNAKAQMDTALVPLAVVSRKLQTLELVTTILSRDTRFETIRGRATAGI